MKTLYKKTSTGALQEWTIRTEDNVIITEWGQVGGAIQETRDTISEGKNLGKSNATTPKEQAESEALSRWELKKKRNLYVEDPSSALRGAVDASVDGGVTPMLAHIHAKQEKKLKFPCFMQPKLDGHRMIAVVEDGECSLWSRTRKKITSLPHIERAVEEACKKAKLSTLVLDGEAYSHEYKTRFEELTSFIRQEVPKPGHEVVEYHIYDIVNAKPYSDRLNDIALFFCSAREPLILVETVKIQDAGELQESFERFLSQGYEGGIARNAAGLYVHKRSYDLLKLKTMLDSEFTVTAVEEGRGKMAGRAIFVCRTEAGLEFRAKMMGTLDSLEQYVKNPALAVGRELTVKYQGLSADGIPRFPVGSRWKEKT